MLENFKSWHNWFKQQDDKKSAYKTFLYWNKIKKECKSISLKFNQSSQKLKLSLEEQYLNEKFEKSFGKIDYKFNTEFYKHVSLIKPKIKSLKLRSKTLYNIMFWLLDKKIVSKNGFEQLLIDRLSNINNYENLRTKKEIKTFLNKNKTNFKEKDNCIYFWLDKNKTKVLSSPFWCILYKDSYRRHYIDNQDREILIIYSFDKKNNLINKHGVNYNRLILSNEVFHIPIHSFDEQNKQRINSNIAKINYQVSAYESDDLDGLTRSNLDPVSKMYCLIYILYKKDVFKNVFNELVKDRFQLNELIKAIKNFSSNIDFGILYYLESMIFECSTYKKWINAREKDWTEIDDIDRELILRYRFNTGSATEKLNALIKVSKLEYKRAEPLIKIAYKLDKEALFSFRYILSYINLLNKKDKEFILSNLMLCEQDKEHAIKNIQKNEDIKSLLKLMSEEELLGSKKIDLKKLNNENIYKALSYRNTVSSNDIKIIKEKFSEENFEYIMFDLIYQNKISFKEFLKIKDVYKYQKYYFEVNNISELSRFNILEINKNKLNILKFINYININKEETLLFLLKKEKEKFYDLLRYAIINTKKPCLIRDILANIMSERFKLYLDFSLLFDDSFKNNYKKAISAWLKINGIKGIKRKYLIKDIMDSSDVLEKYISSQKALTKDMIEDSFEFLDILRGTYSEMRLGVTIIDLFNVKFPNHKEITEEFYKEKYSIFKRMLFNIQKWYSNRFK